MALLRGALALLRFPNHALRTQPVAFVTVITAAARFPKSMR
jgi:hypothetical protein